MKIVVISGTNRPGSNSLIFANHVADLHRSAGRDVTLLDLAKLPAALFAPEAYREKPADFLPFSQAVLDADGMAIIVGEYNGSLPGVLKYFIDMLEFPASFERRPVSFIGIAAGVFGGLRAVEHAQQIFGYRNADVFPKRVFVPKVYEMISEGAINNPELLERLAAQADGFAEFVGRLRT